MPKQLQENTEKLFNKIKKIIQKQNKFNKETENKIKPNKKFRPVEYSDCIEDFNRQV